MLDTAFTSLSAGSDIRWSPPRHLRAASEWAWIPLSDTELLQAAHHLPVAVLPRAEGHLIVAVIDSHLLRMPAIDRDGRWSRGYMPTALRTLPFRLVRSPASNALDRLEISTAFDCVDLEGFVLAPGGKPGKEFASLIQLLTRAEEGHRKLARAADLLILADVLTPIVETTPGGSVSTGLLGAGPEVVDNVTTAQLVALVRHTFLSLDLLSALIFSQRHFRTSIEASPRAAFTDQRATTRVDMDILIRGLEPYPISLDESDLFHLAELQPEP